MFFPLFVSVVILPMCRYLYGVTFVGYTCFFPWVGLNMSSDISLTMDWVPPLIDCALSRHGFSMTSWGSMDPYCYCHDLDTCRWLGVSISLYLHILPEYRWCLILFASAPMRPRYSDLLALCNASDMTWRSSSPWPHRSAPQVRMSFCVILEVLALILWYSIQILFLYNVGNRAILYSQDNIG